MMSNLPSSSRSEGSSGSSIRDLVINMVATFPERLTPASDLGPVESSGKLYPESFRSTSALECPVTTGEELLRVKAVEENDIDTLKTLADGSNWYQFVHPLSGNTLLHTAVLCHRWYHYSEEVFDYLLSFTDFPVHTKNKQGKTALELCFAGYVYPEHFIYELVKRGASIDRIPTNDNKTLLHCAIDFGYMRLFKLLLEMGYDVNAQDCNRTTPLWSCLDPKRPKDDNLAEMVTTLFWHGADPNLGTLPKNSYNLFEFAVRWHPPHLQEIIFNYMIDETTSIDINLEILLILANKNPSLFRLTLERVKVTVTTLTHEYFHVLLLLDTDHLDVLIKNCPDVIRETLSKGRTPYPQIFHEKQFLKNLEFLLQSDLRDAILDCMHHFDLFFVGKGRPEKDESAEIGRFCFLGSYGMWVHYLHSGFFYERHGNGEWNHILDNLQVFSNKVIGDAFNRLIYDVHSTIKEILTMACKERLTGVSALLPYFSNEKLRESCGGPDNAAAIANQPHVPLLVELSRNVFRDFFIKTFQIEDSMQFRSLLQQLHIPSVYEEIILFRRKLYH